MVHGYRSSQYRPRVSSRSAFSHTRIFFLLLGGYFILRRIRGTVASNNADILHPWVPPSDPAA